MCLYTKMETPATAEHDIEVFKVLRVDKYYPNAAFSPFRSMCYRFGFKHSAVLDSCSLDNEVNCGMHSFGDNDGAQLERMEWGMPDYKVFRAVIPKGALYYKGTYGMAESYASDRLIIMERVK